MRSFTVTITEDMIRDKFNFDIGEFEEDGSIKFESDEQRDEFVEECVKAVVDKYEEYGVMEYAPRYDDIITDMANLYQILSW